ncbi:MAG: hypothetical protein GDA39_01355 [Hyphomonadaceae bacterium]|nr:hypothetical protein [Hyphomonadaceae bacterium]MBC6411647.1 hypothetical protein [Hyphomonadaceae bacterium]
MQAKPWPELQPPEQPGMEMPPFEKRPPSQVAEDQAGRVGPVNPESATTGIPDESRSEAVASGITNFMCAGAAACSIPKPAHILVESR